jgi:ankyrin repeat protein
MSHTIFDAARYGHTDKVREFARGGEELVNSKNETGETPLHIAAKDGHNDIVIILMEKGAQAIVKNKVIHTYIY